MFIVTLIQKKRKLFTDHPRRRKYLAVHGAGFLLLGYRGQRGSQGDILLGYRRGTDYRKKVKKPHKRS